MNEAPDDEGPRRAVPDAAQQHGEKQVAVSDNAPASPATKRLVEIIAQPEAIATGAWFAVPLLQCSSARERTWSTK